MAYAHDRGVWVEAELGQLAGVEDDVDVEHSVYTNPEQAADFVARSGCDSLAIAIGTSHGAYKFKGEPRLDFERLEKITGMMPDYPLVLHGASGIPETMLVRAPLAGIGKVNINTELRAAIFATATFFGSRRTATML